jgi:multidrug efflux pump subunit AcrA (membrane-fusion protein)
MISNFTRLARRGSRSFVALAALMLMQGGCEPAAEDAGTPAYDESAVEKTAVTNRIDIPAPVRTNLGITFAKVEPRAVAHTLRVPGRFELIPTARREYRMPLGGRVEVLVEQYQTIAAGDPLVRIDSGAWRAMRQEIEAIRAKVSSMEPLRAAHRVHEESLAEKVEIWRERIVQLEVLREAGAGSAAQLTEAKATLNATQAELADVMEKDASLEAEERVAQATLAGLEARRDVMLRSMHELEDGTLELRSRDEGVVETIDVANGAVPGESDRVLSVIRRDRIRMRATALQADLGRLRDGLACRIVAPPGGTMLDATPMIASLTIDLSGDAEERTIDLIAEPTSIASWARAGVSAHLEITLDGAVEELAVPLACVVRDGVKPVIFRRDPANPDKVIRLEADVGISDGRWIAILSGVREGDEIVLAGNYQLMLASSGAAPKGGHFHSDGTWHEGEH